MRILLLICLLYCALYDLKSQNFVPNGSFETLIDFSSSANPYLWNKCLKSDTPDYFSRTHTHKLLYSIDSLSLNPQNGNAYVGIFCYRINPQRGTYNTREFIQVKLPNSLVKDSLYSIEIFVALDAESNIAIRNFNILFSTDQVLKKSEYQMFKLKPQISFKKSFLEDTSWVRLSANYKAKGYENNVIIGNFQNDKKTQKKKVRNIPSSIKWNLDKEETAAYYYIDNFSIRPVRINTNEINEIKVHPDIENEEILTQIKTDFNVPDITDLDTAIVLRNIFFNFDEAILLNESIPELDRLINLLEIYPDIKLIIEGHTDNIGTEQYNQQLSERRAKAVVQYLINSGIGKSRLSYIGYGFSRPLNSNLTPEEQRVNRRVAFRIINEI